MNFGLLSCLLSECDMKNIEKQYVELLEGKGGGKGLTAFFAVLLWLTEQKQEQSEEPLCSTNL